MDRPPGGWSDLVTNQTLDLKIDALRRELRGHMTELHSSLKNELKDEIAQVRIGLQGVSASVDRRLRAQTWITTTALITGLALAFTAGRLG